MSDDQSESSPSDGGVSRVRYLTDIIVLLLASMVLQFAAVAIYRPNSLQSELALGTIPQLLVLMSAWLLIRRRGERLADIGLKSPQSWIRAGMVGLCYAAVVFALIYLSEKAGIHRNLSAFKDVQGNIGFTLFGIVYSFVGAGFYEEFIFRGFLFQSLAMLFGGSRRAWIVACVLQGALFGLAHAYQTPTGIVITGLLGIVMGCLVLLSGRNLWPVIIGHGLYDASRFVLFYFQGPPGG